MGEPSPAGWYPDPDGRTVRRYFDGDEWTQHWETLDMPARREILQDVLVKHTGASTRVIAQSSTSATLVLGRDVNHVVHVLLVIFTCGIWLPFWLIAAGSMQPRTMHVNVDQYGTVTWS